MDNITIYPKNEKQKSLLESLLQEMKVRFEVKTTPSQSLLTHIEFITKINKSIEQAESGNTINLTEKQQEEFLGL